MISEEIYSDELKEVFEFLNDRILTEHPTTTVTIPYFILSILSVKTTKASSVMERMVTSASLDMIYMTLLEDVHKNELLSMRPNKKYQIHPDLEKLFEKANQERENMGEDKLSTIHIILALLTGNTSYRNAFEMVGINYQTFLSKALDNDPSRQQKNMENMLKDVFNLPQDAKIEMVTNVMPGIPGMPGANPFGMPQGGPQGGKKASALTQFCTNLNEEVKAGKIDKLIGRDLEINKIFRVLGRRKKNNVLLLGDGGVGKTAIVNGIAQLIVDGNAPKSLANKEIYSLDMTAIIAGTQFRGMLEDRFKSLFNEIKKNKNIILFIDDIHQIVNEGKNDMDISEMVNKAMSNGDVQVIGCTTYKLYKKAIEDNTSLDRKFQKINIDPETIENSITILNELKGYYEDYHHVKYDDDAIKNCVILANKYIPERLLPDSALDIIDEAGSYVSSCAKESEEIIYLKKTINATETEKRKKISEDDVKAVSECEAKLNNLRVKLIEAEKNYKKERESVVINSDNIYQIVSEKTGIPISKLSTDEKKSLAHIDDEIKKVVIGQDEAVESICKAIKRSRVGLSNKNKPVSVLAIGSTGVGKTLLAKTIAKEVFGKEKYLVRFDMSEYSDKTAVSKLIGTGAGYVGYDNGGLLTEAIKKNKYCVLLCDEIEKADPEIYNVFLQIMDDGRVTDNTGKVVDCKNLILIFTSNVGTKEAMENGNMIGFTNPGTDEHKKNILRKELKSKFAPEFINRIDEIIYFNSLEDDDFKKIIRLELNKTVKKVEEIGCELSYGEDVVDYILEKISSEKEYGARPIMRVIQEDIENKITDIILENEGTNFRFRAERLQLTDNDMIYLKAGAD
jgi:ATP-dependent Clp protease ATP-binding subunit ClpC